MPTVCEISEYKLTVKRIGFTEVRSLADLGR